MKEINKFIIVILFLILQFISHLVNGQTKELLDNNLIDISKIKIESKNRILIYRDSFFQIYTDIHTLSSLGLEDIFPNFLDMVKEQFSNQARLPKDSNFVFMENSYKDILIKRVLSSGKCIIFNRNKRIENINKVRFYRGVNNIGYTFYIIDNICLFWSEFTY